MTDQLRELVYRHAPVLNQKVNDANPRGDFITRVDFAGPLDKTLDNWSQVIDRKNKLLAHGYYSVVETTTHYFILYAFYHGQDWYDGSFFTDKIRKKFDEHLHDMEGALAIITKRLKHVDGPERVDAFITVSHFHFYSYANWKESDDKLLYNDAWANRIMGYKESVDGNVWPTIDLDDHTNNRFSLYAQSRGHGIRGDRKNWGNEKKIIRYFPSKDIAEEPNESDAGYERYHDYLFQDVHYRLIDFFEDGGLWENRDNDRVFRPNNKGQDAFVEPGDDDQPVAGSANPPWGWDDTDDRHKCGELAIHPAKIVHDYFTGLREFSLEYVHNPYVNIFKS
jgi:hypothetical protein